MKQNLFNLRRANIVDRMLKDSDGYFETGPGIDAGITDILTNIRHLCDKYDVNYDEMSRRSEDHYLCQVHPDEFELGFREADQRYRMEAREARRNVEKGSTNKSRRLKQ